MYMHVHIYMCMCMRNVCARMYTHIYTHNVCARMYTHICTYMYVLCVYVYVMYIHMYCAHVYVYIYVYAYICMHGHVLSGHVFTAVPESHVNVSTVIFTMVISRMSARPEIWPSMRHVTASRSPRAAKQMSAFQSSGSASAILRYSYSAKRRKEENVGSENKVPNEYSKVFFSLFLQ